MSVEKLPRGKSWAGLIGEPSDYRADNRKQSQPGDDIIAIWRNGQPVAAETPYQPIQCHSLTIRGEDFRLVGLYTAYAARLQTPPPEWQELTPGDFPDARHLLDAAREQRTDIWCVVGAAGMRAGHLAGIKQGLRAGFAAFESQLVGPIRDDGSVAPPVYEFSRRHTGALYVPMGEIVLQAALHQLALSPPAAPSGQ